MFIYMKIFMLSADIRMLMAPLAVRIVAFIIFVGVAAASLSGPAVAPAANAYQAAVKAISGAIAIVGSLYLSRAVSLTLLRAGGTPTFAAAFLAAAALGGLGFAEALSAVMPGNTGRSLAAYCVVSTVSGTLWLRFYGRAK
jgi:hypothetical protein